MALVLVGSGLLCDSINAQQDEVQAPDFRAGVDVVSRNVTVSDLDGRFVTHLPQTAFLVNQEGDEQQLTK